MNKVTRGPDFTENMKAVESGLFYLNKRRIKDETDCTFFKR